MNLVTVNSWIHSAEMVPVGVTVHTSRPEGRLTERTFLFSSFLLSPVGTTNPQIPLRVWFVSEAPDELSFSTHWNLSVGLIFPSGLFFFFFLLIYFCTSSKQILI